ncbi:MAG: 4-hydroxybenzoate polyprenyltransferase-like prenyltransferase [Bacteroidota bacterium]|nr:4-hydroxybenzoate polyprenyltransferase-like prenyltransferase [Bacteroidota bacterium]
MYYIRLIRPLNLFIIAATMYLFRLCIVAASPYKIFYIRNVLSGTEFFLLVAATIFIAASGYVINDIFDSDIDAINHPQKVIVGYKATETSAYNLYKILCVAGVLCTLVLAFMTGNYRLSTLPVIIMVILNFYAHTFKKQLIVGNFMIALCTAFTILLIALFETGENRADLNTNESYVRSGIAIAAVVYSLFAFLTTFLREVIKDAEDIEGDDQYGCRTIPIVFGQKGTKITGLMITLILLLILISFVWFFPAIQLKNVSLFIGVGLILPLLVIIFLIIIAKTKANYHLISNLVKVFMCLGIASMLYFRTGNGPYIFVQYANFLKKLF